MAKKLTTFQKELREKSAQVQKQIKLRHAAEKKAKAEERKDKHRAAVAEKKAHAAERKAKQATERAARAEKRALREQGRATRAVRERKPRRIGPKRAPTPWNQRVSRERTKLQTEHPTWTAKHLLGQASKEASHGYVTKKYTKK
jgi:hypothetical protein